MANIKIEKGKVVKIIDGYGFVIQESIRLRNGDEGKRYYTVWTNQKVEVGDELGVNGSLSVKIDEYTGKDNVPKVGYQVNINDAVLDKLEDAPF